MRHEAMIGRTIAGRFTIKRLLGEGGMARVYVAERDAEPREVALKIMNPELTLDRAFVRRFQREAKAASLVKHPNSVRIFEYGVEGKLSYMAMELLVGDDLYQLLERHGALPQARAGRILAEVCDALQAAHEMQIIHRDLKPENIMVIPDLAHPHGERVKVLDFGIAKLLEAEPEDLGPVDSADGPPSAITRVGQIVGTPAYMSPEQCGMLPIDMRSDIYTCGVLLFQLVTGRLPFEGETPFHTASLHIHGSVPSPSAIASGLDPRLEALIMKALAKRPAERHQTARHLAASLRRLLPDLPVAPAAAGPISMRQISSRWQPQSPRVGDTTPPVTLATPRSPQALGGGAPDSDLIVPSLPLYLEEVDSIESAKTLVSIAGALGPPPQVLLHSAGEGAVDLGEDPPTLQQEREVALAPALRPASWAASSAELPGDSDDFDPDDRAVTLVRPPQESQPEFSALAHAVVGGAKREVKTTLRSAEDFGLVPQERRPEIHIEMSGPTARMTPPGDAPTGAGQTEIAPREVPMPARVIQTVRIHQPAGIGTDPLPREPTHQRGAAAAAPGQRPPANSTVPMPPQLSPAPIGMLPPTVSDMEQLHDVEPEGGLLGGKLGLVVGFLAGMLITAVVVLGYLLMAR